MKRLFIAFDLQLNDYYTTLYNEIKSSCKRDTITWIPPKLQHITIRFIGKTPEDTIPLLQQQLKAIAQQAPPFSLVLDKVGMFGSKYQPKVLWFGFSDFSKLKELFIPINKAVVDLDLSEMEGNFVPHLTIGRIRMIEQKSSFLKKIPLWQPVEKQKIEIKSFQLIRSKLTNEGPIYTTIGQYSLEGVPHTS